EELKMYIYIDSSYLLGYINGIIIFNIILYILNQVFNKINYNNKNFIITFTYIILLFITCFTSCLLYYYVNIILNIKYYLNYLSFTHKNNYYLLCYIRSLISHYNILTNPSLTYVYYNFTITKQTNDNFVNSITIDKNKHIIKTDESITSNANNTIDNNNKDDNM